MSNYAYELVNIIENKNKIKQLNNEMQTSLTPHEKKTSHRHQYFAIEPQVRDA